MRFSKPGLDCQHDKGQTTGPHGYRKGHRATYEKGNNGAPQSGTRATGKRSPTANKAGAYSTACYRPSLLPGHYPGQSGGTYDGFYCTDSIIHLTRNHT